MIEVKNLTKCFGETVALNNVTFTVNDACVYGLVGSNGAGKSTLLRLLSGVYKADVGAVTYNGKPVFDNPAVKEGIVFVPDELYFPSASTIKSMASLYRSAYKSFDNKRFSAITESYGLDPSASISTLSKGMRRQAATALALSVRPKYLFLDETFDGLDPVVRQLTKQLIYSDMAENGTTVIISSHSLKELEESCDHLALLHKGKVVLDNDTQDLRGGFFKVQIAFENEYSQDRFKGMQLINYRQSGTVSTFIVQGDQAETEARLKAMSPLLLDILPLSLEEVFVCRLGQLGYSFNQTEL